MRRGPTLPGVEDDDEDRIVLHVDLDCFYAACERLREPRLEGEPVVVGMGYEPGAPDGAVATASYEAREFGVESAQAITTALERLPRGAVADDDGSDGDGSDDDVDDGADGRAGADDGGGVDDGADGGSDAGGELEDDRSGSDGAVAPDEPVGHYRPVDMAYYESVAAEVKAVLHDVADTVREVSIDEAYLDVTDRTDWTVAEGYARHVKQRVEREVGLTASVGVAPTMHAAKVASDHDKPDGLVVVEPGEVASFLAPLPVDDLHGIGPVTARELREHGVETVADLAETDRDRIRDGYGDRGLELYDRARGVDPRTVEPRGRPKSLSRESAFAEPEDDVDQVRERLAALADAVADRARSKDAMYRTIGIKVVLPPYDVNTRERSLSGPVDDPELVTEVALDLHEEFADEAPRKVGVRVSNLQFGAADQSTLGGWDAADASGGPAVDACSDAAGAGGGSAGSGDVETADSSDVGTADTGDIGTASSTESRAVDADATAEDTPALSDFAGGGEGSSSAASESSSAAPESSSAASEPSSAVPDLPPAASEVPPDQTTLLEFF